MIAPMTVNGAGPFRFIVDTGANRSAVSHALAERLGLTPSGTGDLHTVHGVTTAPLVTLESLEYGETPMGAGAVPVVQGPVLAGEHGLLGVDGMRGRRLRMDFQHRCIEIGPADAPMWRRGWTSVQGELRFGHLVVIEGRVGRRRVDVLVDTGSDATLANRAFLEQLAPDLRFDRMRAENARGYSVSEAVVLDTRVVIPRFRMGEVQVRNVSAYVGDFHIFRLWQLIDTPALLIGMDVLMQTEAIAIDYGNATVHFRLASTPSTGSRIPSNRPGAGMIIGY